ncbi:MAG: hypothetical protein LBE12_12835 [Planctomycetaceae bacterium]|jgi:tetratricopeptide (TPR) repeat protein|nr:hypothetical protein [Planctomycetaceae bacterium]
MNRFLFFFFFPILFFCAGTILGFTDSDILFLRGLSDRDLFESVEFFCAGEFQNPNVSTLQKTKLATELVRSRTRQLLLSEPVRRQELRKQLVELETQFLGLPDKLNQPELSFARISLQLQFAITEYSLGDWQRLEADIAPETDRNKIAQHARTTLLRALEQFQQCTEQLKKLRRNTRLNTNPSFEHQYLILSRSIGYQTGLSQKSLALTFPLGDDRIFSLNKAVELLTELASLPINDPIIFRNRIELATCYRLLGNYDKCKELLMRLQNIELTPELQSQAEAELIRYYLAVGNLDEADQKAGENYSNSSLDPDYSLAILELLLAWSCRLNDKPEQQTQRNQMILEQVRRIDRQFGTYWGRRARMFLGTSHLKTAEGTEGIKGINTLLLKMLAEDQFQNGQYTEAVRFFELASRRAETMGDKKETFNNAVSAIAVLGKVLEQFETVSHSDPNISQTEITACRHQMINSLRNISIRFSENPDAAELHLKAVDLTAQAVLKKETTLDNYLILLKEHAECWKDSPKIPPLLFRAAVLLESQNQKANALSMLEKIPNHSVVGLDAVNTAKRCFNTLSEPPLVVAAWFERRLPENQNLWNEADVASAIYAAEQRIQAFARTADKTELVEVPKKAEQLLRNILQYFPEPEQITKIKVQTMLVTVLNDQGRNEEGVAVLQELDTQTLEDILLLPEKRTFLLAQIQLLAKTGKVQEAVNLLKKQLKQYPDDLPFLILLAEILTQQNDSATLTKSIEVWTRIANQSAKNTENWWLARERIIEIYLKLNKKTEAKKELELLRLLYPELGDTTRKKRLNTLLIP